MFDKLEINSPKRKKHPQTNWDAFFPYYAGYPEAFARSVLSSADLNETAVILDPWNGSGTTTYSASILGLSSVGFDLNPVMAIVARARLLSPSEADSIEPLAHEIAKAMDALPEQLAFDPLETWFGLMTAASIRRLEVCIRNRLVGSMTITPTGTQFANISGLAATFYVALFSVCRELSAKFRSSNPTWLRKPRLAEPRIGKSDQFIRHSFLETLRRMARALAERSPESRPDHGTASIYVANSTNLPLPKESVDFVLTSPPYCTRIDYTAATRIELAVLSPLMNTSPEDLGRLMIGSTRVPIANLRPSERWGSRCKAFLQALQNHPSKASAGYYLKTHIDYFDKISCSIKEIAHTLRPAGSAIFVVQDSYYKEIHNDLPTILSEMAELNGLNLRRREDFRSRSMSGINRYTRRYNRTARAVEAVLCFTKSR